MDIEKILMSVKDISEASTLGEFGHLPAAIRMEIFNNASKNELKLIRQQIANKLSRRRVAF